MTDNRTVKHNRAQMRGKPLSKDCYRANVSYHEFTPEGHDFTGCYGLMDWPENVNTECLGCGAYVHGGMFEERVKEVMGVTEYANGGMVSESYIRPAEEGSICPIPKASVIFEGQKLTFDTEDSEILRQLVERHFRKLGGLR